MVLFAPRRPRKNQSSSAELMDPASDNQYEYVVVGSGAGGGTLAARLAEAGRRVILLEAGGDAHALQGGDPLNPASPRLPDDYDVPAFHTLASENDALSWSFFVGHHANPALDRRDLKYTPAGDDRPQGGIFYPRAGTLGGCTAHNAMIFVYPHNADWDGIARLTGDPTWSASSMRRYFECLENCHHRPLYRWLARLGINPTRHGWKGWLPVEAAIPIEALTDRRLRRVFIESALAAIKDAPSFWQRVRWSLRGMFDPNDWRLVRENAAGLRYLPLTTDHHRRFGTRERVLDVAKRFPDLLTISLDTLATRVLLDDSRRAYGVEYRKGARLYRAHIRPNAGPGEQGTVYASREVILCGGAFNSPQLLMLSGIGPPDVLRAHGIAERVALPGVGRNLQDRYEISVVSEMDFPEWAIYKGAEFQPGDAAYVKWRTRGKGLYATNGAVLTLFTRSTTAGALPDLFCMALVARFDGYTPGYSASLGTDKNYLTWVVLKAHTRNTAGEITLRSADPLEPPIINFNQFADGGEEDVRAVMEGVKFVRKLNAQVQASGIASVEVLPGGSKQSDAELQEFIRDNAWGHHACGTCAIGPLAGGGVLASDFRVHHTAGLRVVDASVFPRIPGFFIASAVYLIAEKAADVILADARA
jgi:choline dehydrogenase-like flavoprotein